MTERRKLESILMANGLVSEEQLEQIISYAHAVGIDLHEAVLQKKIAPPDAVMQAYAESIGTPFVHFADLSVDEGVTARVDPMTARQHSFVPVSIDQGYLLLVTTKPVIPDVADELRMLFTLPVRCAICTPAELSAAIAKYFPRETVRTVQAVSVNRSQPVTQKKPKPGEPLSDEGKRDRRMKTFAAFNFTFAFVYFATPHLPLLKTAVNYAPLILLSAVVGGIAAGITWKTLSR